MYVNIFYASSLLLLTILLKQPPFVIAYTVVLMDEKIYKKPVYKKLDHPLTVFAAFSARFRA